MQIDAIIIDDKINDIKSLERIINKSIPGLNIVGKTNDISEAYKSIYKFKPDLVFIDIMDMPFKTSMEFLNNFSDKKLEVIFTTAYNNYTRNAFWLNSADYLLKPININKLKQAVEKIAKKISQNQHPESLDPLYEQLRYEMFQKIAISTQDGIEYIKKADIIHIEADNSYSTIFLSGRKLTTSKNLKEIEALINSKSFYRTHKSHLINLNQLVRYSLKNGAAIEMSNGSRIPIARRHKDEFLNLVNELILPFSK